MKGKKELLALQAQSHKLVWPNVDQVNTFSQFSFRLKQLVLANVDSLTTADLGEASETWEYDENSEEFFFKITASLPIETKPGVTVISRVLNTFSIPRAHLSDVVLTIQMLDEDIKAWRKGLHEMRKLQTQRVLTTEGTEAYAAAVERGM